MGDRQILLEFLAQRALVELYYIFWQKSFTIFVVFFNFRYFGNSFVTLNFWEFWSIFILTTKLVV